MTSSHLVAPVILFIGLVAGCSGDDPGNGTGGNGGDATASGGGDPSTGGSGGAPSTGGAGGTGGSCEGHQGVPDCPEITVYDKSFDDVGTGGGCPLVGGVDDDFDATPTSGVWGTKFATRCDHHVQHCENGVNGSLEITPSSDAGFWYLEDTAVLVYQRLCGNFGIAAHVSFEPQPDPIPTDWEFNGVGLVAATTDAAKQTWALLSFGYQDNGGLGAQSYLTVDGQQVGINEQIGVSTINTSAKIGVCRVGESPGTMHFFVEPQGEPLAPVPHSPGVTAASFQPVADECCLDVGMTAHFFSNMTDHSFGEPRGRIDWVEFGGEEIVDSVTCANFVDNAGP